jgi:hypothetical protein
MVNKLRMILFTRHNSIISSMSGFSGFDRKCELSQVIPSRPCQDCCHHLDLSRYPRSYVDIIFARNPIC